MDFSIKTKKTNSKDFFWSCYLILITEAHLRKHLSQFFKYTILDEFKRRKNTQSACRDLNETQVHIKEKKKNYNALALQKSFITNSDQASFQFN